MHLIGYDFRKNELHNTRKPYSFIAVEGVIGAGKTTFARMLSERLRSDLLPERFEENPFLAKFYKDRKRYAFQTQMFFLLNRYKQMEHLDQENLFNEIIVSDYIFEKDRIFALQNLDGEELKLYETMFPLLQKHLRKPDLVIYLKSSTDRLMLNIKKRGREMEQAMEYEYIEQLGKAYDEYFFKYSTTPLITFNVTEADFVHNESEFDEMYELIFSAGEGDRV